MSSRLRLLLVDENAADASGARDALEGMGEVVGLKTCRSGPDALLALRDAQSVLPDVVVLDINSPGVDGFGVLSAIKADPQLVHLPVVMLSDSALHLDVQRAYALRASAYVIKSSESSVFLRQMDALVGFWKLCRVIGKPIRTVSG